MSLVLREKFSVELNEKEGFINVLAVDEDAFISSQLVELITKSLQSKIIDIRTDKVKGRLEFSKKQYEIKQAEFDLSQKKLAEFKDSNKSISTARFMSELQKLESEYQLQQNILFTLASEYNNNKIKPAAKSQKLMLFIRGNAMSGAPIISGTNQFPNPPIKAGITTKKTMMKPCAVTRTL